MVLVRVAEDQDVDPPIPGREAGVELEDQPIGVRPAVDQQPAAGVAFDQDRVALADVEHRDVDCPVRPRGEARAEDGQGQGEPGEAGTDQPARAFHPPFR